MPPPEKKKCSWAPELMEKAVNAVINGAKLRPTAALYSVPVMSLHDHVKRHGTDYRPRVGKKPIFTETQESVIRQSIVQLANTFYGLTREDLRRVVFEYAETNRIKHCFNKARKTAGKDWFYGFIKRNPEIRIRRPESSGLGKSFATNADELKLFFDNLSDFMKKYNFQPNRIFNVHETDVTAINKQQKTSNSKEGMQINAKNQEKVKINVKNEVSTKNITICCGLSAVGQHVPLMFIYQRMRINTTFQKGGPEGSIYKCSKSGRMNADLFAHWLHHFADNVKPSIKDPVLLILNNHSSHISYPILKYCQENGIIMLVLPPHTSHSLQPLDIAFFGPLKQAYANECDLYMKSNGHEIFEQDVAAVFTKAFNAVLDPDQGVDGFDAAGIYPINPDRSMEICIVLPVIAELQEDDTIIEIDYTCDKF